MTKGGRCIMDIATSGTQQPCLNRKQWYRTWEWKCEKRDDRRCMYIEIKSDRCMEVLWKKISLLTIYSPVILADVKYFCTSGISACPWCSILPSVFLVTDLLPDCFTMMGMIFNYALQEKIPTPMFSHTYFESNIFNS